MFENKPQRCPFGHQLWPGKCTVGWQPCVCAPAREAAERGRGMGHVRVTCNACHDQLRRTVFFEPPHDLGHRPLTGWTSGPIGPVLEPYRAQSTEPGFYVAGPSRSRVTAGSAHWTVATRMAGAVGLTSVPTSDGHLRRG